MGISNRSVRLGVAGLLTASLVAVAAPVGAQDEVSPEWQAVLDEANGQTVNWFMWGGSDRINSYVSDWVGAKAAELGVTINRVPLTDTVDAVNTVLGEKQAGRDDDGSVDMIWINGENFKTGKQAELWACGWTESLPNFQYVDAESAAILNDFGTPVDQCESPWSHAQFAFTYNSDVVDTPPATMDELIQWIKDNPGQFTYPAPPDFTGSVFVRHVLYNVAGGYEDLLGPFDQAKFDAVAPDLWATLNEIEPFLWRGGETYPQSKQDLDNLFANGEVAMAMTYGPAEVGAFVADGIFPESSRQFVFEDGTIGNNNFVAVPYNSPNKAGAQVVANILLSPEAQYQKALPDVWGEFPVIDISTTGEWEAKFKSIPTPESVLPADQLSKNANPETGGRLCDRCRAGLGRKRPAAVTAPSYHRPSTGKRSLATRDSDHCREAPPPASPERARPWVLLTPALLVISVLFLGALAFGVLQSLNIVNFAGEPEPSIDAYINIFNDPVFWGSLWLSLRIALISTALSIVLAVLTALLIFHTERGRRATTFIYQFNLPIPHIVGGVAMLAVLLAERALSRASASRWALTGSPGDFPPMTNDRWGIAIIAEYVWKETVFIGVVVLAALHGGVARLRGPGPDPRAPARWKRFWHVILPLITPAIVSTSIIVFAFSFGAFEVPFLLGQPFPAALPVLAFRAYTDVDLNSRSEAMAISVVIAGVVAVLVFVYTWFGRRYVRQDA